MAFDIISAGAGAFITGIFGAVGFLVKRILKREAAHEEINLLSKRATLAAVLKTNGMTVEEVETITATAATRQRKEKTIEKLGSDPTAPPSRYWTQTAMNERAVSAAKIAEAQLDSAVGELSSLLSEEEINALGEAQIAWTKFRDLQAHLVALEVSGGTLEPLLLAAEKESVTLQRVKALEAIIEQRKER